MASLRLAGAVGSNDRGTGAHCVSQATIDAGDGERPAAADSGTATGTVWIAIARPQWSAGDLADLRRHRSRTDAQRGAPTDRRREPRTDQCDHRCRSIFATARQFLTGVPRSDPASSTTRGRSHPGDRSEPPQRFSDHPRPTGSAILHRGMEISTGALAARHHDPHRVAMDRRAVWSLASGT